MQKILAKMSENSDNIRQDRISVSQKYIDKSGGQNSKKERCSTWIDLQKEFQEHYEEIEDESLKILSNNTIKCNLSKRKNEDNLHSNVKRRRLLDPDQELSLECEWKKCNFVTSDPSKYQTHVKYHMHEIPIRRNEEDLDVYVCLWDICYFETNCEATIVRHVNFHAYHTKLKAIGYNLRQQNELPRCIQGSESRNTIPDSLSFLCYWEDCDDNFSSPQEYYDHIKCHAIATQTDQKLNCGWRGCKVKRPRLRFLLEHCRTHSGERVIACPHCGAMFASNTKLTDHCYRQVPMELCAEKDYLCTKCSKYFPSNRLLRDHLRLHINTYKCSLCDMTCPTPSTLAKHIRYRHVNDRVFKCQLCSHACVTKKDLEDHIGSHDPEDKYFCEENECTYSCRSLVGLVQHVNTKHNQGMPRLYSCHCCEDKKYSRGADLTRHLMKQHGYYWPPGHSRFTYKEDEEGFFRLQTTRYESLEVSEQILNTPSNNELINSMNHAYEVKMEAPLTKSDTPRFIIKSLDDTPIYPSSYGQDIVTSNMQKRENKITKYRPPEDNYNSPPKNVEWPIAKEESNQTDSNLGNIEDFRVMKRYIKGTKNILITINDVDEQGTIIKSEIVNSENIVLNEEVN